jgi:hypothetical protein
MNAVMFGEGLAVEKAIEGNEAFEKKPFVKPELVVLDVRDTQTGGVPDPNEFNPFLQMS